MFTEKLKETLNEEFNTSITENGAVGYRTTGKNLLDMNFATSSMRSMSEERICAMFVKAFYEDKMLALKWLFFLRDIRGGMGERRSFRIILKYLAHNQLEIAKSLIPIVAEYGRWDDLLCLLETDLEKTVSAFLKQQLNQDIENMYKRESISLLAKWLPSSNASSKEKRKCAKKLIENWNTTQRRYRKTLSELRAYLRVVERQMSANKWTEIDYSAVPSRANLIYNNAFLRHDEDRRREYLSRLQIGEEKINASTLFPHDVVFRYRDGRSWWSSRLKSYDETLEQLWKSLPDFVNGAGNTICVADGSGSMTSYVNGRNGTEALDVANALAIYFAERSSGEFKDKYITFSMNPQLVDLSKGNSLRDKLEIASHYNECANTNIEAVFNLILMTAVKNNMTQDELPQNILILSDMEFDSCAVINGKSLFNNISNKYKEHGYKLPRLVFWNLCSRTGTIPVKENELGVALVSGFSPTIVKMVLSNELDPYKCLVKQLNNPRYDLVENIVERLVD